MTAEIDKHGFLLCTIEAKRSTPPVLDTLLKTKPVPKPSNTAP